MKIIDLTHPITTNMPVYPGTEPPALTTESSIDLAGYLDRKITLNSHTGTHIDAPAHIIKGHNTLDMLKIEHFYGPALLLNFNNFSAKTIGVKELAAYQDKIKDAEFLLLYTGWCRYWGSKKYYSNYPVLSLEAAHWLSSFGLKGVGLDTLSADAAESQDYPVHKALLQHNIIIIENLTIPAYLHCNEFTFSCFPLSFEEADGSPIRADAYL